MKNKIIIIFLIFLLIPSFWWLVGSGYFNMHDDLQVMRLFQMDKCLNDGQIPCRWSPDMEWGYGQAMFNYYSAFPYYLGALLRILFPLTYLGTVKMLFLVSFLIGGLGMFKLAKEFWGKTGGLLSAIIFTYAPYHALDIYVRGALSEVFALSLLPWMLFFTYRLIKGYSLRNFVGTVVSIAFVLMTHNISTMLYAPVALIWCIYWIIVQKNIKAIYIVAFAGVLGLGLASFFILPALFEQNIINTQLLTVEYYDFRGHFVTLKQLFIDRGWGDGPSIFGDKDNLSFQIGWPHWWIGIVALANALYLILRKKVDVKIIIFISGLALSTAFFTFLTHFRSLPIWEKVPQLALVQFPWRFLGLTMFFLAFVSGSVSLSKNLIVKVFIFFMIPLTIILNFMYFIPIHYSRKVTEQEKLTGLAFELQQKSALLDYMPKTAKFAPQSAAFDKPKKIAGNLNIGVFTKNSDSFTFDADVYNSASVEVPVMYFPGWKVYVDDEEVIIKPHGDNGLIEIDLINGQHHVYGKFTNTKIRTIANMISLISLGIFIYILGIQGRFKNEDEKTI